MIKKRRNLTINSRNHVFMTCHYYENSRKKVRLSDMLIDGKLAI